VHLGLLFDFPQGDGGAGIERAIRLGVTAGGFDINAVEFTTRETLGHPAGDVADVVAGFDGLVSAGADLVIGPSISDNCLGPRDAADRAEVPAINYSGGERTRSEWMFHYQVGSLEEEPPLLVNRMREREMSRCVIVHDASVVGERYREVFGWSADDAGIEICATAPIDPLATDLDAVVGELHVLDPDVVIYLGLGASSHTVATAILAAGWDVPVLANSALMFGYIKPEWHAAWARWEYVDTIADDNQERQKLDAIDHRTAAGPIGCCAYDIGRLVGSAAHRADRIDPAGLREGLERVKQLPAASGYDGTLMGFGVRDRGALKGQFLVLRAWRDGKTVQVPR
jgi:ABC-type branched-subunit amino acid transport system substrate-binding protein